MVSFLGLKFGSDKKLRFRKPDKGKGPETRSDKAAEKAPVSQTGPRKWDQNLMGEGQYFGSVGSRSVVNGSIRSFDMSSRPGTSASSRISPYTHNTHALAASSMYDLSNVSHVRQRSGGSLNPMASDTNLRTRFQDPSMMPGPGSGSRPGTPGGGRTKAWVNPLDVHFGRTTPSVVPSTPKSPLAQYEFGADQAAEDWTASEETSVFGDRAENIAETIMTSVVQKEQEEAERERQEKDKVEREREEREARQQAQEEEKRREEEWLNEQEKLRTEHEKHRAAAAAAAAAIRSPPHHGTHGPPGHPALSNNRPMNGQVFQGRHDQRPDSRNGDRNRNPSPMGPIFQGQGEYSPGSRNSGRPSPPLGQGPMRGPFQGQMEQRPSSRNGYQDHRSRFQGQMDQRPPSRNGLQDHPHFQGQMPDQRPGSRHGPQDRPHFQGQFDQRPGSRNGPRRDYTPPYGHPPDGYPHPYMNGRPMNGPGPTNGPGSVRGPAPMNGQPPRSPGLTPGPMNGQFKSPRGSPLNGFSGSPNDDARSPPTNGDSPRNGAFRNGSPLNRFNRPPPISNVAQAGQNGYSIADVPSPRVSTPVTTASSSGNTSPAKPAAAASSAIIRDVSARRDTNASTAPRQVSTDYAFGSAVSTDPVVDPAESIRDSSASSAYSVDEIVDPKSAGRPSAAHTSYYPQPQLQTQRSFTAGGPVIPGVPPRSAQRPVPEGYGVPLPRTRKTPSPPAPRVPPSPSPPVPTLRSSPPIEKVTHPSLQPAPLFHQIPWGSSDNDFSAPRPAPSPTPRGHSSPDTSSSSVNMGRTPPTPDPTNPNWPLAPPPPAPTSSSPDAARKNREKRTPPQQPLEFDFRSEPFSPGKLRMGGAVGWDNEKKSMPVGRKLSQMRSDDTLRAAVGHGHADVDAHAIGMARGPSFRMPVHMPTGRADSFGTPLI